MYVPELRQLRLILHLGVVFHTEQPRYSNRDKNERPNILFFFVLNYPCRMKFDLVTRSVTGALRSPSACESAEKVSGVRSSRVWLALETKRSRMRKILVRLQYIILGLESNLFVTYGTKHKMKH